MMNEKNVNNETNQQCNKLDWEVPKLYCLDKGKTEGGQTTKVQTETASYSFS